MHEPQRNTDLPPPAFDTLASLESPGEDQALETALTAARQRLDAFAEAVKLQLDQLERRDALLQERAAGLEQREISHVGLGAKCEKQAGGGGQPRLLDGATSKFATSGSPLGEGGRPMEHRLPAGTSAGWKPMPHLRQRAGLVKPEPAEVAGSDEAGPAAQIEAAAALPPTPSGSSWNVTSNGSAPIEAAIEPPPTDSDRPGMPAPSSRPTPAPPERGPEQQVDEPASPSAASESLERLAWPVASSSPAPPLVQAAAEANTVGPGVTNGALPTDLDPETTQKLRMLRRLNPGKSDTDLLAQLQTRQPVELHNRRPKTSWWRRKKRAG